MLRKILIYIWCALLLIHLPACSTVSRQGEGVVISENKLNTITFEPGDKTIEAAKVGGKVGIVSGGIIGTVIGIMPGLLLGSSQSMVLGMAAGGVVGAGLLGLTGGALGGTFGYLSDLAVQNAPEYEFRVKSLKDAQIITIVQRSRSIPVNSHVLILEKNGEFFIKRLR